MYVWGMCMPWCVYGAQRTAFGRQFSVYHVGPGVQTEVIRFNGRYLYLPNPRWPGTALETTAKFWILKLSAPVTTFFLFSPFAQCQSLMDNLVKMKVWTAVLGEDAAEDGNLGLEVKKDLENAVHSGMVAGSLRPLHSTCEPCSSYTCTWHILSICPKCCALSSRSFFTSFVPCVIHLFITTLKDLDHNHSGAYLYC